MAATRTITPRVRHARITLGDEKGTALRWVHLFGEAPIHVRGAVWDMGASETDPEKNRWRFDDAVKSVEAQLADYHPPMLREHEHNGDGFGLMRRVRVLTRQEAAALGVKQASPRALYGGFEITDPVTLADYDNGRIQYVSPEFRALFRDDTGKVHSLFVAEVSRVSSPVLKHQQTPVSELRGVSLGEKSMKCSYSDRAAMAAKCAEYGVDPEKVEDLLTSLLEGIQVEEERHTGIAEAEENKALEDLRKAQEAEEIAKKEAAMAKGDAAELSDRVKRLETDLRTERTARLAAAFRADFPGTTEIQRASALKLAETDEKGARALLSDIVKSKPAVPAAVAAAMGPRTVGDSTVAPPTRGNASVTLSDDVAKDPAAAQKLYVSLSDEKDRAALIEQYKTARKISLSEAVAELHSGRSFPKGYTGAKA